jgi:hypothetical protein
VVFNASLSSNDGLLANHIALHDSLSYRDALQVIKQWVDNQFVIINLGKKVKLEGIGELFLNASSNLEFTPDLFVNFNPDAYGLPVFTARLVQAKPQIEIPEIVPVADSGKRTAYHRFIPESLKWAAVLAPFIAFAIWGSLDRKWVTNYVHNYSGFYSWVKSTPGKKALELSTITSESTSGNTNLGGTYSESPAIKALDSLADPATVAYAAMMSQSAAPETETKAETIVAAEPNNIPVAASDYHVIGGAFREKGNALGFINELSAKGIGAAIIDTTPSGLIVVSMADCASAKEAGIQLSKLKQLGYSTAWIMKKRIG